MKKLVRSRFWLLAVCLLLPCALATAQEPSGPITFDFDNTTVPLIDLQGTFQPPADAQPIVGPGGTTTPISFAISMYQNGRGRLTGATNDHIPLMIGEDVIPATYRIHGSVTGGGVRLTRANIIVQLSGNGGGTVGGVTVGKFSIVLVYKLFLNVDDWALEGTCRGLAHIGNVGNAKIASDAVVLPVPGAGDGSWSATLDVVALKNFGGSGTITLPTGRVLTGKLSGKYNVHSGLSRIRFTGINDGFNDARGTTATFLTLPSDEDGTFQLQALRGRIAGQTVLY